MNSDRDDIDIEVAMTTPTPPDWTVTAAADRATLDARRSATVSFTVTNLTGGPRSATLAITTDAGREEWFTVAEPVRLLDPGAPVVYPVRIAVPADVAPGAYAFRALAYASEGAPEENPAYSGDVTLDVPGGMAQRFRWWWLAVPAALLLIAAVVVAVVLVNRPSARPEAVTTPTPTGTPRPDTVAVPNLAGLTEPEAVAALDAAGLTATVKRRHDPASAGAVAQSIPPGIEVARGTSIEVIFSLSLSAPRIVDLKWTALGSGRDHLVPPHPFMLVGRLDLWWVQPEPGISSWRVVFSPCFTNPSGSFNLIHTEVVTVTTTELSSVRFYPVPHDGPEVRSCSGGNLFIYAVDDFGTAGPALLWTYNT